MPAPALRVAAAFAAAALLLAVSAGSAAAASSVAYIDGHNLWLSSPDGVHKLQVTQGGTEERPWNHPAQGQDGKTVVAHREEFEGGGGARPVLYLYGPDGKLVTANVMPVYSGGTIPVYPIGLDMDWNSQTVAYGYSYCGFACESVYKGYWLTFSDHQPIDASNPQGQSDAFFPTYVGRRVISTDSGGNVFVQPDVQEAPFTHSYEGWFDAPYFVRRVDVSPVGQTISIEWSDDAGPAGIRLGQHQGTIPSDVTGICDLPTAAGARDLTFSPDGKQIAWADAEGVKVAGAPTIGAGGGPCSLTAPPQVIAPGGHSPHFGGADVAAFVAPPAPPGGGGDGPPPPGGGGQVDSGPTPSTLALKLKGGRATRARFARGLTLQVGANGAGPVAAFATVPAKVAKRLRLKGARASALRVRAVAAAARPVIVAKGRVVAQAAGPVALKLKPTAAAKRRARKMRNVTLTVKVTQGPASGTLKIRLR